MERNGSIQILRAVAALLVVYTHTLDMFHDVVTARQAHFHFLPGFGACGVDIFFAISGFIMSSVILKREEPPRAGDFLKRRFIRIFPIYWIYSIVFAAMAIYYGNLTASLTVESLLLIPTHLYPLPSPLLTVGWTLMFEMFFYYVLAVNLWWRTDARTTVLRAIGCVVGLVALGLVVGTRHPVLTVVLNPINLEFAGGGCLALLFAKYGPQKKLANVMAVVGAVWLLTTVFTGYAGVDKFDLTLNAVLSWQRVVVWGIPALLLMAGMAFRARDTFGLVGRAGVFLGDASYSIYLSSVVTLLFCERLLRWFPHEHLDLMTILFFLIVSAVGAGMYVVMERPITRWLMRRYHLRAVQSAP